jgi:4-amino-4-deoxy-L-arabinose transferase-like glycosyltransferase
MVIVKLDQSFTLRWVAFYGWVASITVLWYTLYAHKHDTFFKKPAAYSMTAWYILIIAVITRFLFLSRYPFVSIGDSLRDGGLDAMDIANGTQKNIFAYGRYESHGLIIPTIASIFFKLYGASDLTFKVPSAILGVLDIVLLYQLVAKSRDKAAAFFASIFLICMPLHLFYSRTELVVICSSILMTVLLGLIYTFSRDMDIRSLAVVSLLLGVCLNFHASIRAVVFITIPILAVITIFNKKYKTIPKYIFIMIIFMLIGFGPRLFMSSINIIFHTRTVAALQKPSPESMPQKVDTSKLKNALNTYPKAFLGYFYENVNSHYDHKAPILPFFFGMFFLVGIAFALVQGNTFWRICAIYALIIPFTNSALTEAINADHRLAPLFPLSAALTGYGVSIIYGHLRNKAVLVKYVLLIVLLAVSTVRIYDFFDKEYAVTIKENNRSYLAAYIVTTLKNEPERTHVCFSSSKKTIDFFQLIHIREYFRFMLPNLSIEYKEKDGDDTLYIINSCDVFSNVELVVYCQEYINYMCPEDRRHIQFFLEKDRHE